MSEPTAMDTSLPAIFVGHGNPALTLGDNTYTRAWRAIGDALPRPAAVLAVSAHWYGPGTRVTAMPAPPTLHDFAGLSPDLYLVEYPAPGDPGLAGRVRELLRPVEVALDEFWGLDHGTWSVLRHLFPRADVPLVQLSLDAARSAPDHYALAKRLAPLRDEGVLIVGSGNLVHNLRAYAWGKPSAPPLDWAVRFERRARRLLAAGDHEALIDYASLGPDAALAVPFPDHYLPLLYVLAQQRPDETVTFPVEGIEGGAVSMLAVRVG